MRQKFYAGTHKKKETNVFAKKQTLNDTRALLASIFFRNKLRYMCLILGCVIFGTPCSAEEMTLEAALALAYSSNPQLDAARASLRATDEEVAKALAGWRPTVAANGSYGWQQQKETLLGSQTTNSIPQAEQLTVSQPVFDGRTIPNTRHAKALVAAGRAQLEAAEETVLFDAANAYFAVLRDTKIVEFYHDDVINLRKIAENTASRLRLGELTKTDAAQAAARLLGSQMNLTAAEQQLNSSRASFEHAVGRPAEALAEHDSPEIPTDEQKALKIAVEQNPTLNQSKAQAVAAAYAVDAATGALLPTLSIQGVYGRSANEIAPGVSENGVSIIGQLSIPLYQGGAEQAAVREAKEQSAQAELTSQDAERQVREDFSNAWKTLYTSREAAGLARNQATDNEAAYQGSIMESQVGSRSIIDILNADQELLQSKIATITQTENSTIG